MSQIATLPETHKNGNGKDPLAWLEKAARRESLERPYVVSSEVEAFLARSKGVIHIGAHIGQEREVYHSLPVVWIEALPRLYDILSEQIKDYPKQRAILCLVADGKTHKFNVASNAGQSSSIFDFKQHRELWPDVGFPTSLELQSHTLKEIVERHRIDLDVYDALVLDVQGAELMILQNAGDILERFKWIHCEAADFEAYDGGCTLAQLDRFLALRGFTRQALVNLVGTSEIGAYHEAIYENTGGRKINATPAAGLRLNLGAGNIHLDGFVSLDRKTGQEVYPLPYEDGTVDEIVASHVLEHFSHRETGHVVKHWVQKLKPGGKIRLAVPDFEIVAREYMAGKPLNVQGYVMGGHADGDDRHGAIFDRESLTELMMQCGLERIGGWKSDVVDCASLPISLNLQGFKPASEVRELKNVRAVYSTPRFGPLQHCRCIERMAHQLRLETKGGASCYWHQMLSVLMEQAIAEQDCEYVLTMDFDTIFAASDVLELYRLMQLCPEADAIFPVQSKRGCTEALFSLTDSSGRIKVAVPEADLERFLIPANTGHFGLTLFRAESLRKFKRPWMLPMPNSEGMWDNGQIDADIAFWMRFKDAGFKAFLAPRVVVGHLEEIVKWPGKDLKPVYQKPADYDKDGIPAEVVR